MEKQIIIYWGQLNESNINYQVIKNILKKKKCKKAKWLPEETLQIAEKRREEKGKGEKERSVQFSSVQSLSHAQLFATPWTAPRQASLSITSSQSLLKLTSIKSVMPSNHLVLCCPLLLPSIFPASESFPISPFFAFLFITSE